MVISKSQSIIRVMVLLKICPNKLLIKVGALSFITEAYLTSRLNCKTYAMIMKLID